MGCLLAGRSTLAAAAIGQVLRCPTCPEPRGNGLGKGGSYPDAYRLLNPGSEWRLHRHWFGTTAFGGLLGVDARAAQDDTLYRALDLLLDHKEALFGHLREQVAQRGRSKPVTMQPPLAARIQQPVERQDTNHLFPIRSLAARGKSGTEELVQLQLLPELIAQPAGTPLARMLQAAASLKRTCGLAPPPGGGVRSAGNNASCRASPSRS